MKSFFKTLLASLIGTFIALFLVAMVSFSVIGSMISFSKTTTPEIPQKSILKLDFSNAITEQTSDDPMNIINPLSSSSSSTIGILDFVQAIDAAADDPRIEFIYMNPFNLKCGLTHAEEIRDALLRFKQSGKAVITYGEHFSQLGYYLASASDKIYISPAGTNDLIGLSTNLMFFKDILQSIGVNIQLIRHGKFKSAGEQFINSSISEENRLQNQVMVSSIWNSIAASICESRGMSIESFNNNIDNLNLSFPEDMKNASLVDEILTREQMSKQLCTLFQVDKEKDLKMTSIETYSKGINKPSYKIKNKIAVIYADGEITFDKEKGISSEKFSNIISKVRRDSTIKSVVFRINSPGGAANAAEIIRQELLLLREVKPIIVSFGDYAASGGYWIAANSDKIFTNNLTLTGSIGVFSMIPSFKGTMDKININSVSINSNKHSDMLSLQRPLDNVEIASMQRDVERIYDMFLDVVSGGRDMSVAQVDSVAQGRVWAGSDALNIKLADSKGGLIDAIHYAATSANLEEYRLVEYPVVTGTLEKLMEQINKNGASVKLITDPQELIKDTYLSLKDEIIGTYARLPYYYDWGE